jgi:septum formation protein
MNEIILASASPRRSELLRQIGLNFRVLPSNMDETLEGSPEPTEYASRLACGKALGVAGQLSSQSAVDKRYLVIGADTIVVKNGILGKPENEAHAFQMLKQLQGDWHEVITGVSVVQSLDRRHETGVEVTRVKMRSLSDAGILAYIRTGEPFDKAGAYGIQGMGALLVEKIEGCYFNVVGLPLYMLSTMLERFGTKVL